MRGKSFFGASATAAPQPHSSPPQVQRAASVAGRHARPCSNAAEFRENVFRRDDARPEADWHFVRNHVRSVVCSIPFEPYSHAHTFQIQKVRRCAHPQLLMPVYTTIAAAAYRPRKLLCMWRLLLRTSAAVALECFHTVAMQERTLAHSKLSHVMSSVFNPNMS